MNINSRVVEHRIARLVGLGISKNRYFGRGNSLSSCDGGGGGEPEPGSGYCRRRAQNIEAPVAADASAQLTNKRLRGDSFFYLVGSDSRLEATILSWA